MHKYSPKLTINILTFKTDKMILKDCIESIDKSIPVNIIENSNYFLSALQDYYGTLERVTVRDFDFHCSTSSKSFFDHHTLLPLPYQ